MRQSSFVFDSVRLAPSEQIGMHQQDTWELSYVVTGCGRRSIGNVIEAFQPGEVVLIPPQVPHCWQFESDSKDTGGQISNMTVTFGDAFLQACSMAFPELNEPVEALRKKSYAVKFDKKKSATLIALLKEMERQDEAGRVPLMLQLLLVIVSEGKEHVVYRSHPTSKNQDRMNQVRIYVSCNARRSISLDDAARHVGMNRSAFCVFFKKATGKTFVGYLNEYRVELACQQLRKGKKSISEVCYSVGFNDVPYFNRVFKHIKGVPPTEYVRKAKG